MVHGAPQHRLDYGVRARVWRGRMLGGDGDEAGPPVRQQGGLSALKRQHQQLLRHQAALCSAALGR